MRSRTFFYVRNGRRTTLGKYPKLSLTDARRRANEPNLPVEAIKARDAVTLYLDTIEVKPRTRHEYQRLLTSHFLSVHGHKKLTDITT